MTARIKHLEGGRGVFFLSLVSLPQTAQNLEKCEAVEAVLSDLIIKKDFARKND